MARAITACFAFLTLLAVPARATDLPEIQKHGSLRVLVVLDTQRPEFFSMKPEAPGFDREILEGFAKLNGLKLDVISVPTWEGLIPALLEARGDVIAGRFTATELKRKSIQFTSEVFPRRLVVMTRKPHRVVNTLEELRTEKVGTLKGTALAEAVAAAGVPRSKVDDGFAIGGLFGEALRSGRITAAVWGVESVVATQREDPAIQLGMFLGKSESIAYGLRKEDQQLLAALNQHIGHVHKSGGWSRLVLKYFGQDALEILKKARSE